MNNLVDIQVRINNLIERRNKLITKMLDGRTQLWLATQTDMDKVRLSNCLNIHFTEEEIKKIEELLLSKI